MTDEVQRYTKNIDIIDNVFYISTQMTMNILTSKMSSKYIDNNNVYVYNIIEVIYNAKYNKDSTLHCHTSI